MNILLLNDNPVVTKLVTLSAQKTSDMLDIVSSVDDIKEQSYDLFVLDDTLHKDDILSIVKAKTSFSSSLYICSRDSENVMGFDKILKKPFLPTDLVEIFAKVGKDIQNAPVAKSRPTIKNNPPELELEEFEFDNTLGDSILDSDEVQEVQNLLNEVDVGFTYDIEKVATELSFSPEALTEFLEDFIAQAEEFRGPLYGALDLSDYETLHSTAHKLKGVAANLSIKEAYESLIIINQSNENDIIKDELDKLYIIIDKLNTFIHKPEVVEDDEVVLEVPEEKELIEEVEDNSAFELEDFSNEDILELGELNIDDDDGSDIEELDIDMDIDLEDEVQEEIEETISEDFLDMPDLEIDLEEEIDMDDEVQEEIEETISEDVLEMPDLEIDLEDDIDMDDEVQEEIEETISEDVLEMPDLEIDLEDDIDMDDEVQEEIEEAISETEESKELDLQTQIDSAVLELSEEDLASEIDADSILDISVDDVEGLDALDGMNSLDALSSQDIKSAIGEDDSITEIEEEIQEQEVQDNGVEALKTLLAALSDKNVAASLKGMKINISITLGDN